MFKTSHRPLCVSNVFPSPRPSRIRHRPRRAPGAAGPFQFVPSHRTQRGAAIRAVPKASRRASHHRRSGGYLWRTASTVSAAARSSWPGIAGVGFMTWEQRRCGVATPSSCIMTGWWAGERDRGPVALTFR